MGSGREGERSAHHSERADPAPTHAKPSFRSFSADAERVGGPPSRRSRGSRVVVLAVENRGALPLLTPKQVFRPASSTPLALCSVQPVPREDCCPPPAPPLTRPREAGRGPAPRSNFDKPKGTDLGTLPHASAQSLKPMCRTGNHHPACCREHPAFPAGAEQGQCPPHECAGRHLGTGRQHRGAWPHPDLTVRRAKKGNKYEVVAGARRLAALRLLVKEGRLAEDVAIPCKVLDAESDAEISLAENTQREAMHIVDEILAYRQLA